MRVADSNGIQKFIRKLLSLLRLAEFDSLQRILLLDTIAKVMRIMDNDFQHVHNKKLCIKVCRERLDNFIIKTLHPCCTL